MLKKISIILITILLLVGLSINVFAKDTYTTTSVINGVTVNWQYDLNESNQIEDLKCTNPEDITGNVAIPSTLDGKTVISIGNEAFKSATGITGITIPSSVEEIGYSAFENCTNLNKVDLGNITTISFKVFKGCTSLTEITIPKTLKNSAVAPCLDNPNITKITLEEGLTIVPKNLCANTGITEITIPTSVEKIEYCAFKNCSNLENVNLGQIKEISFDVFENCPKLTEITIPKTLVSGPGTVGGVFTGTTNLTSVIFEEGTTTIVSGILKDCKEITTVAIPNTVKKIGCSAFENTGIVEIAFPDTLKEIEYDAFKDCSDLIKITILDNCTEIGGFNLHPTKDTVFQNHNDNLTIYCYENSKIAEYAIANNIKYKYLKSPETDEDTDEKDEQGKDDGTSTTDKNTPQTDDTTAKGEIPQTGTIITSSFIILIISVAGIIFYVKYKKFRDI